MSMHTPGPWEWWTSNSFRRLSSKATGRDGDVLHAVVQHSDGHPDVHFPNGGFTGPDARLIAAAPDLLAALQEAMSAVKTFHGPDCWDIYEQHSPEMKRWRAVIAQATGSSGSQATAQA